MKTRMFGVGMGAAGALLMLVQMLPAKADDASELQTKIRAALRTAKTFVQTVTMKGSPAAPLGGTATFTVVAPNRYRQYVASRPSGADDTIIIGHEVYGNEGKGWTVQTWTDRLVTGFEGAVFAVKVVAVGSDQTVDGKTVGSFVMVDPRGAKETDTMNCTYQKQTFRPISCSDAMSTIEFLNYDDPNVTIEMPKNAKRTD
jgi:hypothetical protein